MGVTILCRLLRSGRRAVTRAQSVSHYNQPTLVSPPLASLRHLRDLIPTLANGRSPPGSRSISRRFPVSLPTLPTVPLVRLLRLTSLSPPAPRPYRSSTPPIRSRRSPVFPEFSVLFRLCSRVPDCFPFRPSPFPYLRLPLSFSVHLRATILFPFSVRYAPLPFRLALYLFFPPILRTLPVFIVRPSVC